MLYIVGKVNMAVFVGVCLGFAVFLYKNAVVIYGYLGSVSVIYMNSVKAYVYIITVVVNMYSVFKGNLAFLLAVAFIGVLFLFFLVVVWLTVGLFLGGVLLLVGVAACKQLVYSYAVYFCQCN